MAELVVRPRDIEFTTPWYSDDKWSDFDRLVGEAGFGDQADLVQVLNLLLKKINEVAERLDRTLEVNEMWDGS